MVTVKTKTCAYWSCQRELTGYNYLCREHYNAEQDGLADKCPKCGRYKDAKFDFCPICSADRPVVLRSVGTEVINPPAPEPSHRGKPKAWAKRDEEAHCFFAYILKLDGGEFYAGHTRDLRERISEHQDDCTKSSASKNPRLQYFEILPSRDAAEAREIELKKLCKKNPREIRRLINGFHDLLRIVDLEQ